MAPNKRPHVTSVAPRVNKDDSVKVDTLIPKDVRTKEDGASCKTESGCVVSPPNPPEPKRMRTMRGRRVLARDSDKRPLRPSLLLHKNEKIQRASFNVDTIKPERAISSTPVLQENRLTSKVGRVIYVGHLPIGCFEPQLRKFFSQFGVIRRVKLFRSKKTARSRGYAFVEFDFPEVAAVAAEAMNHYRMFGRTLVCHVVPPESLSERPFENADRKFKRLPWQNIAASKHNKMPDALPSITQIRSRFLKQAKKMRVLGELGIDYDVKLSVNNTASPGAVTFEKRR